MQACSALIQENGGGQEVEQEVRRRRLLRASKHCGDGPSRPRLSFKTVADNFMCFPVNFFAVLLLLVLSVVVVRSLLVTISFCFTATVFTAAVLSFGIFDS